MLINLIKLFQSAAERSTFKQACGLNDARWGGRPGTLSPSLLNTTTSQHGYCTSQERAFRLRPRGSRNGSPTLRMQRQLAEYRPSAATAEHSRLSRALLLPGCKHTYRLYTWKVLVCIRVLLSPQFFIPSFHLVHANEL